MSQHDCHQEVTCNFSMKGQKFKEKFMVVVLIREFECDVILGRTFINSNRVKCNEWMRKENVETGSGTEQSRAGRQEKSLRYR